MEFLIAWMDLVWVPIALLMLRKGQRFKGVMFVLTCVASLRVQVQLMERIGYPTGIIPLLDFPLIQRGFIAYGTFIATFLILSHFSREKDHYIYIAAAITVFVAAFCVSSFVLVL